MKRYIAPLILWFLVLLAVVCQIQNATHNAPEPDATPSAQDYEPLK